MQNETVSDKTSSTEEEALSLSRLLLASSVRERGEIRKRTRSVVPGFRAESRMSLLILKQLKRAMSYAYAVVAAVQMLPEDLAILTSILMLAAKRDCRRRL